MQPADFTPDDLFSQIQILEQALQRERAARAAAEHASHAKSDLLATVSHEVRTPLGAIISMADLLLATGLDEKQRHYASTLRQSGRGLLAILNDILDYSKLSAGRFELEYVRFDFIELMRAVGAALSARAGAKGLESALELDGTCPQYLVADPVRIRQVLNNLIDNALKFTETGRVVVRASFSADGGDGVLSFEVCDTGIGITEAEKAQLFRPYSQGSAAVAARYGGTGLGLSIAKRLAELMGGEMDCESVDGQGTVFRFTIRARCAEPETTDAPALEPEGDAPAPGADDLLAGRVLIVEDNGINQMLISAYLENFGLAHEIVSNGHAALDALATEHFDLVLMDIMMPGIDGLETTRRIRALPCAKANVPIVALTANAMKGDRETYLAAGMDGYVSKPVSAAELFAALGEHLERAPRMTAARA